MRGILIPVDPDKPARVRSAVEQVLRICQHDPVTVRLLRVQPEVSGHVAMYFGARELKELQVRAGAQDLEYAQRLLDLSGVPYISTVRVGRSAPTIVAAARDFGCDRIIFGHEEAGLAGMVFGSLAQQVRQLIGASADLQVIGS